MRNRKNILKRFTIADLIMIFIIIMLCLTCVLPFVHLLSKSISDNSYVLAKDVYFLPKGLNFEAYIAIFKDGQLTHSMLYSVLVTLIFTVLGLVTTIMAAWPLSRKRLKGRIAFTFIIMFTMYFGAGLIPTYLLYSRLKLLNTMWVLILPLIFAPYNFLIMKTYFQSNIPASLEESAYLDGASNIQILVRIVLPISKPILATISLFLAVGRWNAYQDSKFFITKKSLHMIQYLLSMMVLSASETEKISISEASLVTTTPEVIQAAAIMFVSIPVLCVYPFAQKYFVKGIMIGAIKG
ncbi:MAG TPA: carbohydrate ABC transporter permease [Thermoclostridium sp.]